MPGQLVIQAGSRLFQPLPMWEEEKAFSPAQACAAGGWCFHLFVQISRSATTDGLG